ncbi:sigma-54-dependent transcriptional regulator [Mangrovicella endophytica]|uniref:sigma-54-dependent transcriptional regulator n=1 Tax=Mangrovicella endophytica TaxID=2066697 RepID=UPI000C9E9677|nr:sigma-54 dependent transcriptional regulator [Mangrovicella endophytica]
MEPTVLIVDDDPVQRRLLEAAVARLGVSHCSCSGGAAALSYLQSASGRAVAAMVLDLMMPDLGGLAVLEAMRRDGIALPVIVQTAKGGIDTVVAAMRVGAFDFVVKPASPERLQTAFAAAMRVGASRTAAVRPDVRTDAWPLATGALRPVLETARKAAASAIPILLCGETGSGKEWLARVIQEAGPRAGRPFVAVNCGALPEALVESILFGHEKGAFTDATERHRGKFVEAHGGTLFLDEVGELSAAAQVKLLRALQGGEIDPVGAGRPVRTDVRLISATNRDLAAAVRDGSFREDLYYRLNVLAIELPPLRQRREEIEELANGFVRRCCAAEGVSPPRRIGRDALALLRAYNWPGNIRQLQNAIHRAVVLGEGTTIGIHDFPQIEPFVDRSRLDLRNHAEAPRADLEGAAEAAEALSDGANSASITADAVMAALDDAGDIRTLEAVEAELIRRAVIRYGGRMSEVARRLAIGRSTLYRKLQAYGIET